MLMFGLLLLNANYLQVVRADDLHNDANNPRLILEEYSRERGPILVGDKAVASSVATDDRLKYQRKYAQGPLYAPATGFYSIVYGASGIEAEENSILAGTDDSLFVRRVIDQLTGEPVKGGSVQLTLNAKAQKAAYDGLRGRKGAVVAIEPSTGAILALVTSPSYNPSVLSLHDTAKVRAAQKRLTADPDKPMLDRALRETYPPGSTFKLVTASAALESGKFRRDTKVYNGPRLDLPQTDSDLPNFDGQSCSASGRATLEDALKRSCNAAFGKVGLELGADAVREQAEKYGFNSRFEVPMITATQPVPHRCEPAADRAVGHRAVRRQRDSAADGDGRGDDRQPRCADEPVPGARGPRARPVGAPHHQAGRDSRRSISPQTADTLAQMMATVVEEGTGSNAQIDGVRVGGKTGTAQQGSNRKPHAWFVSLAPINDAKVAVAVVLEDGGGAAEVSGNQLAAPIARSVMLAVLGPMRPDTDVLLGDRYLLTERIAGGGMGEVWAATDEVLGRPVAVKILRREYADDPTFLERFRAEARHAAGLSHSGIAAVYDYGEDDGSPFIVMELVPGEALSAEMAREGAIAPDRTLDIIGQAALALQIAHDGGVIHRDVKPGNLLLTPDGTVKITDFGIARATDSVPLTLTGAIMGTAYYISPEQASGESVTPASDVYSLGIVAYECLTGRRPFDGNTPVNVALAQVREEPPALPAGIPEPVTALVMRMLAKDPADRPASAGELGREALALRAAGAAQTPATKALPVADADATRVVGPVPARGSSDTNPGFVLPPLREPRAWLPYVIAAAVVLVLVLATARACSGPDTAATDSSSSTAKGTAAAAKDTVTVDEADYVGRPLDQVRTELTRAGARRPGRRGRRGRRRRYGDRGVAGRDAGPG